jgi:hypothetical protein
MPIKESSRPYLEEIRALARDRHGREVLIGLTHEESEWYLAYAESSEERNVGRDSRSAEEIRIDRRRYLELHDKHETAE